MRFGFVVHPLGGLQRRLLGVRSLDPRLSLGLSTRQDPARVLARMHIDNPFGARAEGILVGIPQLPEELLSDQEAGVAAVIAGVELCRQAGAEVVGLGAVCAVIGGQGKAVARAATIPVSTGNGFTALAAVETLAAFRRIGGAPGAVGLIGPPGPVGTAILHQLVARGELVEVVAPNPPAPLRRLAQRLNDSAHGSVSFVDDPLAILSQGRVLVAASSTGGRLRLSQLPPQSVVIDVAAPQDVSHDVPERSDVLILDGEYVRLPRPLGGGFWHHIYGLVTGQARSVFACFAEPMLMALAEDTSLVSVGRTVPLERVRKLAELAAAQGFWVDRLHEGGKALQGARLSRFVSRTGMEATPPPLLP